MNINEADNMEKDAVVEKIRKMSVDGFDEWVVATRRRRRIATVILVTVVSVAMPVVSYACFPSPRYAAYCSTSDAVNINTVRQETIEIFNTFNK